MEPVRNSGKAIIIQGASLLVIVHRDDEGLWYSLPGGGQEPGETLPQALQRERREELGVSVNIGALRYVREYIGANHEFSREDAGIHAVDFMFECSLLGDLPEGEPPSPDSSQIGIAWIPLKSLLESRLYPKELRPLLTGEFNRAAPIYLGDVN